MWKRILLLILACLLLLSSCSVDSGSPTASLTATPTDDPGNNLPSPTPETFSGLFQTEQMVLTTQHPLRDLYSLAQRLKLHTTLPIAHVVRTTPLNAHVGQSDMFWVYNQDTKSYTRIQAQVALITPHLYMYVENGQPVNLAALQSSANTFETTIYPMEHTNFGSEWSPGIDDDVHITVLNAIGLGASVSGYFSPVDEYPVAVNPYSNQRDMFYISLDGSLPGSADYTSTLAGELEHMIHWYQHPLDLAWSDEGMAVLAQHLSGYTVDGLDQSFLQNPDIQLNDWPADDASLPPHYGAAYLFMDYFAEHYGGDTILKEVLQDPAPFPDNFNHVLAKHGYADTFMDVLHRWYLANFVNDATIDQGEYGYPRLSMQSITAQHMVSSYPFIEADAVHQYGAEYYDLQTTGRHGTLTIDFQGSPTVRIIGNDPLNSTNEWWGNRYDTMDSTLTRSFDLTSLRGKHVTLQFATWYDLEANTDYAFVEASTDGKSWTTLKGHLTTTNNPTGNNWGNGYTGISGGESSPTWQQESIDLSAYAGKKIQLRFEEVTDTAVNMQGVAIDDIRIPELHFQDTLDTDNGWVSNGFIRSHNVVPEHYHLQALIYQDQKLTTMSVDVDPASGQKTLAISGFGSSVSRVVLVVSASATETTLLAHYQVNIHVR